jgi:hypothetical protein
MAGQMEKAGMKEKGFPTSVAAHLRERIFGSLSAMRPAAQAHVLR